MGPLRSVPPPHELDALGGSRKRCLAPGRTFIAYMDRLTEAFRAKYVAAVVLTYGVNQGMGERFLFSAQNFYVLDSLGLMRRYAGIIDGFANVPWQLKSLFGLLSDTVPINGLHRSPYMFLAGILGVAANLLLTMLNPDAVGYAFAALLLLLANVNFAVPDVMIDATVAERAKTHPAGRQTCRPFAGDLLAQCRSRCNLQGVSARGIWRARPVRSCGAHGIVRGYPTHARLARREAPPRTAGSARRCKTLEPSVARSGATRPRSLSWRRPP